MMTINPTDGLDLYELDPYEPDEKLDPHRTPDELDSYRAGWAEGLDDVLDNYRATCQYPPVGRAAAWWRGYEDGLAEGSLRGLAAE